MEFYKTIEIAITSGNRIDAQWGFFITIHLAILGGIIYVDRPLSIIEKIVALSLYLGFALINYFGLSVQQDLLNASIQQIYAFKDLPCCENNTLSHYYVNLVDSNYRDNAKVVAITAHIIAVLAVTGSIIADKADGKLRRNNPENLDDVQD